MTDVLITAGELAELVKKEPCVIIDTRNPDAYAAGHLPGAVNVHDVFTFLASATCRSATRTGPGARAWWRSPATRC